MLRRILWWGGALPAALALLTLAVINRQSITLVLDPFRPEAPLLSLVLPFYAFLFASLLIGILIGGATVWLAQAQWRRSARRRAREAQRWRAEADRLGRKRAELAAG